MPLRVARLCVAVLCGMAVGCQQKNEFVPPPPPEVTVANPVEQVVEEVNEFTGVTTPVDRVEIRARVEGFLDSIEFTEGDEVQAGQPLFVIDPRPFQADLDAANASLGVAQSERQSAIANLKQAEAQAANDEAQYNRALRASRNGAVTEAELDELRTARDNSFANIDVMRAAIDSAEAQIAVAQAAIQQAQLDYSYTQVNSPISGRVGKRMVDVGNLVGSGESTLLTTVITYDPIYATFTVSETEYLRFMRRAIEEDGTLRPDVEEERKKEVRIGLADEEGFPHIGRFDYADLAVDQTTGTYLVRAIFPNTDLVIPAGAFVRIQVPLEARPVLLIDEVALGSDQNGSYVTVVGSDNKASRKRVTTGRLYDGKRVITGGLEKTDRVVVNGVQKARPGSEVRAVDAAPETPAQ